ncbi:MAG TPA: hypothetical protein VK675_04170 [Candidatus Paceibacterota bacterium]|nr:hypothetical protein [Candidatus Paceibacterota bacterium]
MALRILASALLLVSILFLPVWVSAILGLAGIAYFSFFLEAVLLFFLSDLLYGVKEARFFNVVFVSLIAALICFTILELIKRKIRFHAK